MMSSFNQRWWVQICIAVWGVACAAGFAKLWVYGNTPSERSDVSPASWEIPAELVVEEDRYAMNVFAHPKCP